MVRVALRKFMVDEWRRDSFYSRRIYARALTLSTLVVGLSGVPV